MAWGPPETWSLPLGSWAEWSNPYLLAFASYDRPAGLGVGTYLGFLVGSLGLGIALTGLAASRIRRVVVSRASRPSGGVRRWRILPRWSPRWPMGPSLDSNPVAWREWHRQRPSWMMRIVWGIYAALGLLCVLTAWLPPPWGRSAGEDIAMMCLFQVSVGLLLLSVGSATSLAEERASGSLDVLLSTPISTRSILVGKWWGGFRRVLGVAIWPAMLLIVSAVLKWQWLPYLGLLGLVLAYGAALTSLGLLMATWVGRPGRAVALCVAIYVVGVIGWPIVVFLALRNLGGSDFLGFLLFLGDPAFGAYLMSLIVVDGSVRIAGGGRLDDLAVGAIPWIGIDLGAAAFLNWVAYTTFDACLGRTPDAGIPPPPRPGSRSSLSADELLALVPTSDGEEP